MPVTMATSARTAWVSHPAIHSPGRNSAHFPSVCPSLANRRTSFNRRNQSLRIHASSAAQGLSSNERLELSFIVGTRLIPHPDKVDKGGEDALFVSTYNGGVLAVADGVSGWAEENIDPAVFPRELMANISLAISDDEVKDDPQLIVRRAHETTHSIGSATIIIAMLEKFGTLKIANVGDCGLRILREGRIIFSTSPQEHYFDCPFQLSSEIAGQTYKDAMVYSTEVKEGDIIVMGSDGLFDNVFDHEIESVVSRFGRSDPEVAHKTVEALANLASVHARDPAFDSPYCLEARIQGFDGPAWKKLLGIKFTGGKLDDITVIVGTVVNALMLPQLSHLDGIKDFHEEFSHNNEVDSLLEGNSLTNELQPNITKPISGASSESAT